MHLDWMQWVGVSVFIAMFVVGVAGAQRAADALERIERLLDERLPERRTENTEEP
jgi:hypothetical protein